MRELGNDFVVADIGERVRGTGDRRAIASVLFCAVSVAMLTFSAGALAAERGQRCVSCHNQNNWSQAHANLTTCASCHGKAGEHTENPNDVPPTVSFGPNHFAEPQIQNNACLNCHQADTPHWDGGTHAVEDVVCSDCHDAHAPSEPVLLRAEQQNTCYGCHRDVRAEVRLPSRHPILEGKLACTDCHAPHGAVKRGELVGLNLNDTCLECHEDQRGPFLFEHPPVAEDCSYCHVPHGAVHEPLLESRGPFLCQECHVGNFHPSNALTGSGLPGARPNYSLLGRNCMNCHPKVHGSNHPSGARLTR